MFELTVMSCKKFADNEYQIQARAYKNSAILICNVVSPLRVGSSLQMDLSNMHAGLSVAV